MDDISAQLHKKLHKEKNICEHHFLDNVCQNSQGYTVKLPVREQMLNNIGDSCEAVLNRDAFQARSYA